MFRKLCTSRARLFTSLFGSEYTKAGTDCCLHAWSHEEDRSRLQANSTVGCWRSGTLFSTPSPRFVQMGSACMTQSAWFGPSTLPSVLHPPQASPDHPRDWSNIHLPHSLTLLGPPDLHSSFAPLPPVSVIVLQQQPRQGVWKTRYLVFSTCRIVRGTCGPEWIGQWIHYPEALLKYTVCTVDDLI